jgi:hypothetical protein
VLPVIVVDCVHKRKERKITPRLFKK